MRPRLNRSSWRLTASLAVLALAAGVVYWPALSGGFIFDDEPLLTGSALVKASDGLYRMWFTSQPIDYWPMTNSSFWLEWRLWGVQSAGYHVTNLLLHFGSALLVWAILRRLAIPGAWLAAALFLVHPVNVESVAWIAQRKNTLSMVFFLLSILWYLNGEFGRAQPPAAPPGPSPSRSRATSRRHAGPRETFAVGSWYWLSLAAFAAAMLSKASVAVLPAMLLLLVWWKRRTIGRADLIRTAPFFVVAVALTFVNFWFQAHHGAAVIRDVTPLQRVLGAGAVIWFYLSKALLPIQLMFVYPQWHVRADNVRWWLPLAGAIATTALLLWQWRRPAIRALLCAWAFFLLALLPVMGLTDVYFMKYALVADHYQYIALLGVVPVVAAGLMQLERFWHRTPAIVGGAVLIVLASATWRQSHQYANAETLYVRTLEANPGAWVARNNLALLYLDGPSPDLQKAFAQLSTALATNPEDAEVQNNVGTALFQMDRFDEAARHHREAVRLNPNYAVAYANLGHDLGKLSQFAQAADAYRRALELDPDMRSARTALGVALEAIGQSTEAGEQLQRAAQSTSPTEQDHTAMGDALQRLGRIDDAIAQYREALTVDASSADTLRNLGHALIAAGRFDEAERYLRQAVALRPDNAATYDNLGNALQQMGRLDEAVVELRLAVAKGSGLDLAAIHNDLGVALARQNHREEAIQHFREALRINPQLAAAQANLTRALAPGR